ncbi:MAG: 8-oxoguanine deaminase [Pseudomonadota bacterium]
MTAILIDHADVVVTMDDARRELPDASVLMQDGAIKHVAPAAEFTAQQRAQCELVDARGTVVTPGLVNTHNHLYQTITRVAPAGQDGTLFEWLRALYPVWAHLRPPDVYAAVRLGLAELALSGCTLCADHHYLFPNGVRLDDTIDAARTIGLRFHATRGALSVGESDGGLPPDAVVEREADIINDTIRVIDQFHDPSPAAMLQIGAAPCSPFSVSTDLMRETAALADDKGVMLHTHLAENHEDIEYCQEVFGCGPGDYLESLGWTGPHVWCAHCVKLSDAELDLFGRTGVGVAHCPTSNGRLGSGIAPLVKMLSKGVRVGLGVDGASSNDAGHLLLEARLALLMQRAQSGAHALSARQALEVATRGGADVLGRPECGRIDVGKRADIVLWPVDSLQVAGALDPVAALVLCAPIMARDVFVEGRAIVRDGRLTRSDHQEIIVQANTAAQRLAALC